MSTNNTLFFDNKVVFIGGQPITLPTASADPGTAVPGDMYFNTVSNTVRVYNGTSWTSAGGSGGITPVALYDPVSTTLTTGSPVTTDGVTVTNGMIVLYSNLSSGNNEAYQATVVGGNVTAWTAQPIFSGSATPVLTNQVIVAQGNSFANQVGEFNGATWTFNRFVRYFNGVNYFEQDAIAISTLADNTTNGTVTSYTYAGSEYAVVEFSINRGTARDTGSLYITSDGTNVSVATNGSSINSTGVTFNGVIVGGTLFLRYNTTSTGSAGTMKFMIRRWSDAPGGPAGIPSYSGGGGSTVAAGPNTSIQFNNSGLLDGSGSFLLDTSGTYVGVAGALKLNGLSQSVLSGSFTLLNNTSSPATIFSYPASTFPYAVIEYSIVRNGDTRVGRLMIANNGSISSDSDDYAETNQFAPVGITFSTTIVGSSVAVQYTSTSTGFNATFKYSSRAWS